MSDSFEEIWALIINNEFAIYCNHSINRPELAHIAKNLVLDSVYQRKLMHTVLSDQQVQIENVLKEILPQFPFGCILKLGLLLQRERRKIKEILGINVSYSIAMDDSNLLQSNNREIRKLWKAWIIGDVKMDEYFRILGSFLRSRRINMREYVDATDCILRCTGYFPVSQATVLNNVANDASLTIPQLSTYFVYNLRASINPTTGVSSAKIEYRPTIGKSKIFQVTTNYDGHLDIEAYALQDMQPVSSLNNIFWSLVSHGRDSDVAHSTGQLGHGCKLINISDSDINNVAIIIEEKQKTRTSTLEINQVVCIDGEWITKGPSTLSVQLAIIVEGCYIGRQEDEWQNELFGDSNDAVSEIARTDVHNHSPNASGQDDNHNIIPDYSWKSGTFLLNIICTESFSITMSIIPLHGILLGDQRVTGVKLQREWVFLYGLHGLCAVHQTNKCFPRLRKTSLVVPDTTLLGRVPALNEHRFHSHNSLVTTIDVSEDATMFVSGDDQGKICLWATDRFISTANSKRPTTDDDIFPSFQLLQWFNNQFHNHHKYSDENTESNDIDRDCWTVHMLRLSPSTETIVAAIGTQLFVLKRSLPIRDDTTNMNCSPTPIVTPLSILATVDIQDHCLALYDVCFDHQCGMTIWRLTSPLEYSPNTPQEFMTISVWQYTHPSLQNIYGQNNKISPTTSVTIDHQGIATTTSHIRLHESPSQNPRSSSKITGFVKVGSELIPIAETVNLSINLGSESFSKNPLETVGISEMSSTSNVSEITRESRYLQVFTGLFSSRYHIFIRCIDLLAVLAAAFQPPTVAMLSTAMDMSREEILLLVSDFMSSILYIEEIPDNQEILRLSTEYEGLLRWLTAVHPYRIGGHHHYWIDVAKGHNLLCAMYLRFCGNKSIAIEHPWQSYLQTYGPYHLRRASRGLRTLTLHIRKIDETANIKLFLPHQIGYISGLQEIYARRVGLSGAIPAEIGELSELRVLSMGNNRLTGPVPASLGNLRHLQRIVLHQNNLVGEVPAILGEMGCIVNLAGNPRLEYGPDVPTTERDALIELFHVTKGHRWTNRTNWCTTKPISKWYKVGVLSSHVHSLVMSSNNMDGVIPPGINRLTHLRMIELATMQHLTGPLPKELCRLTTLRRLCICRCGLTGTLPDEIGLLINLEELQLFGNRLTGKIPSTLGNLVNLKLLSLGEYTGGNDFNPGYFPPCIERLRNLEALFLADCRIKGPLPSWIGNLTELRQLDLQRNQLTGSLPASIGRLSNLLYLNIKDNPHLSGRLPVQELSNLSRLNRLSLVHCAFEDRETALQALRHALPRCKIWL